MSRTLVLTEEEAEELKKCLKLGNSIKRIGNRRLELVKSIKRKLYNTGILKKSNYTPPIDMEYPTAPEEKAAKKVWRDSFLDGIMDKDK